MSKKSLNLLKHLLLMVIAYQYTNGLCINEYERGTNTVYCMLHVALKQS